MTNILIFAFLFLRYVIYCNISYNFGSELERHLQELMLNWIYLLGTPTFVFLLRLMLDDCFCILRKGIWVHFNRLLMNGKRRVFDRS